jgi:hypothetical protein
MELVLTPHTRSRRARTMRMLGLFVIGALPVAAVLVWLVNPLVAVGYVVVQTAFLWFGLRQQHQPHLRLHDEGVQFEPGSFVIRCNWDDIERIDRVTLPSGPTEALVLGESGLGWALDAGTRREVSVKGWDRVIPLSEFEDDWRRGRIGHVIGEHAPRLLADPPSDD